MKCLLFKARILAVPAHFLILPIWWFYGLDMLFLRASPDILLWIFKFRNKIFLDVEITLYPTLINKNYTSYIQLHTSIVCITSISKYLNINMFNPSLFVLVQFLKTTKIEWVVSASIISELRISHSEWHRKTEAKPFLNSKGETYWIKITYVLRLDHLSRLCLMQGLGCKFYVQILEGKDLLFHSQHHLSFRKPWGLNSASSYSVSENQLFAQRLGRGPVFGFQTSLRY